MKIVKKFFGDGWKLMEDAFAIFLKWPVFLVPIMICWAVVAGVTLYIRYYWIAPLDYMLMSAEVTLFLFVITYSICIANMMMLELLQGVAQGREVSLVSAFLETVFQDSIKAIPIAVIWSLLWFVLLFLRALTSKKRGGGRAEPSVQDAARTLGGMNSGATSWFGLGLSMLEELLRMVSFLALPGIAWKGLGPIQSLREAFGIIRKDPMIFLSAYTLTGVAATIMAIPIIILFSVTDEKTIFPASVWTGVIIYEGMIWVLSLYLEQMTLALLYINNDPELFPQNNIELNAITNRMVGDIKTHEDKLKGGGESILHTPKNETKISSTLASVITWGLILLIIFMAVIYFSFFG